jgi:hypothetical protein
MVQYAACNENTTASYHILFSTASYHFLKNKPFFNEILVNDAKLYFEDNGELYNESIINLKEKTIDKAI